MEFDQEEEQVDYEAPTPEPKVSKGGRVEALQDDDGLPRYASGLSSEATEQDAALDPAGGAAEPDMLAGDELLRMQAAGLKERVEEQQALIEKLQEELRQVKEERQALADERVILVKNMSCLFKTAQLEIGRKDEVLRELRKKEAHWLSQELQRQQQQQQHHHHQQQQQHQQM
ncbi:hypothetical protein WJX72_011235 [[Myrmecia] bisecta]|uniref:Uncharacterized protein n=1 Tax=[Myrmecia] bisecta TaxID=41462 RepID=A0AAW1Q5P3_9CHLO